MRQEQSLRTNDGAEDVIRQYAIMVYRLAFARSGTKDDADEIFQEVFFRYLKNQPVFESEEHCKAWLIRVTINCSRKLWSSAWRRRVLLVEEDLAFDSKETADLYHELQKLPAKYRQVIHLYYYEDLKAEQIGKILNRKPATIRTQLTRARAMLRDFMKEEDDV